jgi:hypothetical protein
VQSLISTIFFPGSGAHGLLYLPAPDAIQLQIRLHSTLILSEKSLLITAVFSPHLYFIYYTEKTEVVSLARHILHIPWGKAIKKETPRTSMCVYNIREFSMRSE